MPDVNLAQLVINFLTLSAYYSLFSVGLALIFGVMKIVNFAHGEFFMLGGYSIWLLLVAFSGLPLWLIFIAALIVGPIFVAIVGVVVEWLIFEPTKDDTFAGFMASLGLSYVLQAVVALSLGVVSKSLPIVVPGQIEIAGGAFTYQRLLVVVAAIVLMFCLWYFLGRTRHGRAVRAASQNRSAALLQGINLRHTAMLTMAIGAALAGVAGVLMASVINIGPYMGLEAIWKAFIVVIVGGLGSIPGAILAALLFGFIDSAASIFGFGQYIVMIDTIIMLVILAFFPRGLLGREAPLLEQGQIKGDILNARPLSGATTSLLVLLAIAALASYPFAVPSFLLNIGVLFLINVILVVSYRLITTMGGWSFAHITMLAVGAYAMALAQTKLGLSFWIILPMSGAVAAVVALIISYPILRTRQFYFFLSTFAAGEAIRQSFIQFETVFGGIEGIPFLEPPGAILGIAFGRPTNFYLLALVVVIICCGLMYVFDRSRLGRSVKAVAQNENLSEAVGVNTWAQKALAFCIGSFFAGIAGALFAGYNGFVAPTDYTTVFMFKIIAAVIIGGTRTFWGPILGLVVVTIIQESMRDADQFVPLIWGLIIIFTMLFLPRGLESLFLRFRATKAKAQAGGRQGQGAFGASAS